MLMTRFIRHVRDSHTHPLPHIKTAIAILLLACFVLAPYRTAFSAEPARPPNVVLILGDDMGWGDYGFMGHETIKTPHLDRLAQQSAVFTHGYVPTSLCRASLATIITGLYAHQHKITSNDPPKGTDRGLMLHHMREARSLPRLLSPLGYESLQTGKWWEGNFADGGFTHGMTHGDKARGGRHGDLGLTIGRNGLEPIFEFIRGHKEKPFFIWYAPIMPHEPHTPPERLLAKYTTPERPPRLAKYWAMCEWYDETCGQLLDFLDREGQAENTLVIYLVDNGWIQETGPKQTTRGWFAPKSKLSPYDGGLRTPILLRWPGKIKPGKHDALVSSIDLVPTVLAACEIKPPAELPGVNLLPVAAGKPLDRKALFGELFSHDAVDIERPAANLTSRWCREGSWKLILPVAAEAPAELYDVSVDPTETKNLAAGNPDVVQRLRKQIDAWWPG